MSTSPLNETPAAAAQVATIYVPLELSKSTWLVGLHVPALDSKLSRHQVEGGDCDGLVGLIDRARQRLSRRGLESRVVCCYEAGFEGFWLHRQLEHLGIKCLVLDAASLEVNRRARRAKTDRLDLERLLRALMALEGGDSRACSVVRVPRVAEEDAKQLNRQRDVLVANCTRHSNRIKGLLLTQGIRAVDPRRPDFADRLDRLTTGDGRPLPEHLKVWVQGEHACLLFMQAQLATVESRRAALLAAAAAEAEAAVASAGVAEKALQLMKLKALGPNNAWLLSSEVYYRDYDNRRKVAAYTGLVPAPFKSGTIDRDQGISKAGNPRARTQLIETAWLWVRYQPDSPLTRWFHARVGTAKGRIRRIAIVAVARKLAVALWRYLETGLVPEGAIMKA